MPGLIAEMRGTRLVQIVIEVTASFLLSDQSAHTNMSVNFDDLPLREAGPPLNAWGLYGDDDELGRLNLITPEVVKQGLLEAKHGIVINLK